jgi:hypothetical protein
VEEDLPRSRWLIEIAKDQSSLMAPYGVDKHDFSEMGLDRRIFFNGGAQQPVQAFRLDSGM